VPHSCPRADHEVTSLPSPGITMQKGNTDPFSTPVIVVDATVSQLLSFSRSCLLPSIHGREINVAKNDSYATSYWQDSIVSLLFPKNLAGTFNVTASPLHPSSISTAGSLVKGGLQAGTNYIATRPMENNKACSARGRVEDGCCGSPEQPAK
jgi:hypothetical protein